MIARAIACLLLFALLLPASASAATRYATPAPATGADCSSEAKACSLATALTGATAGDEVVVGQGTYGTPQDPSAFLFVPNVDIRGAGTGALRPVINQRSISFSAVGGSVTDLEINTVDSPAVTGDDLRIDRVLARTDYTSGPAVYAGGAALVTNSLFVNTAASVGQGLDLAGGTGVARNVTAIAPRAIGTQNGTFTVANSILLGSEFDLLVNDGAAVTTRNANYDNPKLLGTGTLAATNQQTAAPALRGGGDFRQALTGSPTVGAGDDAQAVGPYDLNGNLRTLGITDIGAYEAIPLAPAAATSSARDVARTTATLRGGLAQYGAAVTYRFEFGPAPGLGKETPPVFLLGSTDAPQVSAPVTGLTPGTAYAYRLVASSDAEPSVGGSEVFTTVPDAPAAGTPSVGDITATTATLTGAVDLKQATSGTVTFTYGSASTPATEVTASGPVTAALTGLTPDTTYAYALKVTTAGGTAESAAGSFTTAKAPVTEPAPSVSPAPTTTPAPSKPTFSAGAGGGRRGAQLLLSRKTITVFVRCGDVACRATASGYVTIGRKRYGTLAAPKTPLRLDANESGQIKLGSSRRLRKRVRRYLNRHRKAGAKIHLKGTFVADDGTKVTKTLTIKVRRLKK